MSEKAWLDKNNVPTFRADVPLDEARELQDIIREAFNAGLQSGYKQGYAKAQSEAAA